MKTVSLMHELWPSRLLSRGLAGSAVICGCGHSGTTLIANILGVHPAVYLRPTESNIFKHPLRSQPKIIRALHEARQSGRTFLLHKRPNDIFQLDGIRKRLYKPIFICPVRDGRDVSASLVARGFSLEEAQRRWIESNTVVAANQSAGDCFVYRHEDLTRDPGRLLLSLCEQLGLAYTPDLLRYHEKPRHWFGEAPEGPADPAKAHEKNRSWQVNQPIFDNSGRWKAAFNLEDFGLLQQGSGQQLMARFGYDD
jgi:hypothetical protein